jgi:uncharacterized protein YajQ (UPF0234 family)
MPSFDAVSEVDLHELNNAVDQANRELSTRFDFRGVEASFKRTEAEVEMTAQAEIQLDQMLDILRGKLVARKIDTRVIDVQDPRPRGKLLHQTVLIRQGIETELARKIVKMIKDKKMKVQAAIQGEKVRVTGKKRDDLQQVMAMLKESEIDQPLQFNNFRDSLAAFSACPIEQTAPNFLVGADCHLQAAASSSDDVSWFLRWTAVLVGVFHTHSLASR